MHISYVMDGTPGAAFTPVPASEGIASRRGLWDVEGEPGTMAIPSPSPGLPSMSEDPRTNPSHAGAPDAIYPNLYIVGPVDTGPWTRTGAMHTHWRDTVQPVPSIDITPTVVPSVTRRARIGGRRVWPMPRVIPHWPSHGR